VSAADPSRGGAEPAPAVDPAVGVIAPPPEDGPPGGWVAALRARIPPVLLRPLAGNASVVVVGQVASTLVGLLTSVVAARVLGPSAFGSAALLMSFPSLVLSITAVKSLSVTTRYMAAFRATGQRDELRGICKLGYGVDLAVGLVAFVVIAASGWWVVPRLLGLHGSGWLLVAYAASLPFHALGGTSMAVLTTWDRFKLQSGVQVAHKALILGFTVVLLWAGLGWSAVVLGTAAGQAVIGVAAAVLAERVMRADQAGRWWSAPLGAVRSLRGEITSFFGWNYLHVTGTGVLQQAPLMLLGRLAGLEAAGYFRLALTFVTAASYLETSLARVTYPLLSARWAADDRAKVRRSLAGWTLRGGLPAAALLLLGIPILPIAVPVLLDARYAGMVPGAQVMLVGGAASVAFFWLQPFYYSAGLVSAWVKGSLVWITVVALAGFWVARHGGYVGMSALTAMGEVGLVLSMLYVLHLRRATLWRPAPGDPAAPEPPTARASAGPSARQEAAP
jgi:O-antigen/teichoic acid export membrane protein